MTRTEHLLTILAEECAEVAQRASKALRFGLSEVQPGQTYTNTERLFAELVDLEAVIGMLIAAGVLIRPPQIVVVEMVQAKKAKVEKFLAFSAARGLVDGATADPSYPHPESHLVARPKEFTAEYQGTWTPPKGGEMSRQPAGASNGVSLTCNVCVAVAATKELTVTAARKYVAETWGWAVASTGHDLCKVCVARGELDSPEHNPKKHKRKAK